MRLNHKINFIALSAIALGIGCTSCSDRPPVQLQWEMLRQEFTLKPDQTGLDFEFNYSNPGKSVVSIGPIHPDCGCCTTAGASLNPVPPGGVGTIQGRFAVENRIGYVERKIKVFTTDPNSPVELSLGITIPEVVRSSPASATWSLNENTTSKTIRIDSPDYPTAPIVLAEENPQFQVEIKESIPGKSYLLVFTPKRTDAVVSTAIKVSTGRPEPRWATLSIPVSIK